MQTSGSFFKCPRCGKYFLPSEISYYQSEETKRSFSGRYMVTKRYEKHIPMCKNCASYRNKADEYINGIGFVLMIVCVLVFITGDFFGGTFANILLGIIAGAVMLFIAKYSFYIYDNIKMYYVRKKHNYS